MQNITWEAVSINRALIEGGWLVSIDGYNMVFIPDPDEVWQITEIDFDGYGDGYGDGYSSDGYSSDGYDMDQDDYQNMNGYSDSNYQSSQNQTSQTASQMSKVSRRQQ